MKKIEAHTKRGKEGRKGNRLGCAMSGRQSRAKKGGRGRGRVVKYDREVPVAAADHDEADHGGGCDPMRGSSQCQCLE